MYTAYNVINLWLFIHLSRLEPLTFGLTRWRLKPLGQMGLGASYFKELYKLMNLSVNSFSVIERKINHSFCNQYLIFFTLFIAKFQPAYIIVGLYLSVWNYSHLLTGSFIHKFILIMANKIFYRLWFFLGEFKENYFLCIDVWINLSTFKTWLPELYIQ